MDLNKAMIIGRLTRDPEMRSTPQGVNVCTFSIATNSSFGKDRPPQVEYHNIVVWRKLAEIANQYLRKGSQVYVEGRIQTRNWQGNDGQKKNRTEIVVDNLIMLGSKAGGMGSAMGGSSNASESEFSIPESAPTINQDQDGDEEITVEDIPF